MIGHPRSDRPPRRRPVAGPLALSVLLAASAACHEAADRPRRPRGSAVWVDPQGAWLTPEGRRTLGAAGVGEVFLESAAWTWRDGGVRLDDLPSALGGAVPSGMPVTLVLRGEAPPDGVDREEAARELAGALRDLRYRAERADLLPLGVHLDVGPGPGGTISAGFLRELRRSLGRDLLLSTSLPPERMDEKEVRAAAAAVDFVVAFLYGQAPGQPDEPAAWDPEAVSRRVGALEGLGRDYLVGLHVLGRADHLGSSGEHRTTTTRAALGVLARDPALRLSLEDPFAGVGRLVHTFQAQGASRAAGWQVAPGDRIRVVRTAPALLRDVVDRVEAAGLPHHSGYLLHRVAAPEEDLSLAPAELAAALGGASPVPDLRWRIVVQSRQRDFAVLQVELSNWSRQRTDLAVTDGNFLEIRAEGGYFERVDAGAFSRYTLWRGDQKARPGAGWREPDGVRLHTPMVAGGGRIGGAVLHLRTRTAEPAVRVSGRFFLPDGGELELPAEGGPLAPSMEGPGGDGQRR